MVFILCAPAELCFSLVEPNNQFYLYLSNLISFFIGREAVSCQHCQGKYFIYSKYFLLVYLLKVGFHSLYQFLERNPLVAAVLIWPNLSPRWCPTCTNLVSDMFIFGSCPSPGLDLVWFFSCKFG